MVPPNRISLIVSRGGMVAKLRTAPITGATLDWAHNTSAKAIAQSHHNRSDTKNEGGIATLLCLSFALQLPTVLIVGTFKL
jgi:hypothetical protein